MLKDTYQKKTWALMRGRISYYVQEKQRSLKVGLFEYVETIETIDPLGSGVNRIPLCVFNEIDRQRRRLLRHFSGVYIYPSGETFKIMPLKMVDTEADAIQYCLDQKLTYFFDHGQIVTDFLDLL